MFAALSGLYYLCRYDEIIVCCRRRQLLRRSTAILALHCSEELLWSRFPVGDIDGQPLGLSDVWGAVCLVSAEWRSEQLVVLAAHYGGVWWIYYLFDLCQ